MKLLRSKLRDPDEAPCLREGANGPYDRRGHCLEREGNDSQEPFDCTTSLLCTPTSVAEAPRWLCHLRGIDHADQDKLMLAWDSFVARLLL